MYFIYTGREQYVTFWPISQSGKIAGQAYFLPAKMKRCFSEHHFHLSVIYYLYMSFSFNCTPHIQWFYFRYGFHLIGKNYFTIQFVLVQP